MPIYEYRCGACGEEEEVIQSVNAEPLTDCPACGKPALKKLVSAAAFHLKGTGWYVTDFRDNDKKKGSKDEPKAGSDAKSDSKAGKESKDTSDAKKETKPDAPKKTKGSDSAAST